MRCQTSVRPVLESAAATLLFVIAGCQVQPDVEVTTGSAESPKFSDHVEYYSLDLPSDAEDLEWIQLRDWDSNQIYLRFRTDSAGLETLLDSYRVRREALEPARQPDTALPAGSNLVDSVPSKFRTWHPSTWASSRKVDNLRDTNPNGLELYVDLLVDHPRARRPDVFIHVVNF